MWYSERQVGGAQVFGILAGPVAVLRAFMLLVRHPVLFRRALLPVVSTILLVSITLYLAFEYRQTALEWIWPTMSGNTYVGGLVGISAALISICIAPWIVMLVGIPLCGPLIDKAEDLLDGRSVETDAFTSLKNSLVTSVAVVAIGLSVSFGLFILGLLPGIGFLSAPIAVFVWTPLVLAFDLFDTSLSRRELNFTAKRRVLANNFARSLSVGLTGMVCIAIPVLNLIGLPVAILAAVIVIRDLEKKGRLHS